jgi:hypothetical protein
MNQATSQRNPRLKPRRAVGLSLVWLGVYTLLVLGLAVLFYRFLLNKMWLVPVLAEIALIKSPWTTSSYWKGLVARFAGIANGNTLAHFLYVIPVIYEGKETWSEEALWAYVIVGAQTAVAAVALFTTRALVRKKLGGAS